ncbi:hypothetical protein Taro_019569 [Colocasia esculenta]|uniref:Retrotransposon gag domain-containing protein n=1 Tax=Colocasia esculenta TaxID=4460 RepID=A0A843UU89_COLES|nr:hypothetical protein [Colocasia esculenta]
MGATPSRRLVCGYPPLVSQDIECDSVLWVFVDSRSSSMAPRRRPREGVAEQATHQEVGDAPPPQQTQPLPQDAHSGIVPPPPPPPQVAQGLDMTRFLEGMAQFVAQHRDALIPWQEFVVSFKRAFCPTYVRTERLYQFLDLQQRDFTVVQYRARFLELGRYAPQIMGDEGLRTQQFVRGLRPELRQALIVARVTDLDAAYQTATALEADTLRTRARSAEVQTQVVPSQPRQQQGSVQTTPRTATSYASTSTGTTAKSGSRRKFRRDRRQAEQRQQSVGSVQQPSGQPSHVTGVTRWVTWREIVLCYLVCRSSRPSHSPECSSSSSSRHLCSSVSRPEVLVGRELRIRAEAVESRVVETTRELATLRVQGSSVDQEELARLRADLHAQQTLARGLQEVMTAIGRSRSRSRSGASGASGATGASVSQQRNEDEERRLGGETSTRSGRGGGEMPPPPDRHEGSGESGGQ